MNDNKNNQRRAWSEQEDVALRRLYEGLGVNKWSLIAEKLSAAGFHGRTGKQCRERYNNQLDPALSRDDWTFEQERKLYRLHDQLGNRWAVISSRLSTGRSDNSIKNHFYSRLRKSMRRINRLIKQRYRRQLREIQMKVLYKIIEAGEEKFKAEPMCDPEVTEYSCTLKNKILMFSYEDQQQEYYQNEDAAKALIDEIVEFNRKYKRKPKKFRKLPSLHEPTQEDEEQGEFVAFPTKVEEVQDCEDQQQEDSDEIRPLIKVETQQQKPIKTIILAGNPCLPKDNKARNEQILQALGLLEDDLSMPHPIFMKKTTSVISSEHSQEQQQFKFFEDSEAEMRIMATPVLTAVKRESMEDRLFQQ